MAIVQVTWIDMASDEIRSDLLMNIHVHQLHASRRLFVFEIPSESN